MDTCSGVSGAIGNDTPALEPGREAGAQANSGTISGRADTDVQYCMLIASYNDSQEASPNGVDRKSGRL